MITNIIRTLDKYLKLKSLDGKSERQELRKELQQEIDNIWANVYAAGIAEGERRQKEKLNKWVKEGSYGTFFFPEELKK